MLTEAEREGGSQFDPERKIGKRRSHGTPAERDGSITLRIEGSACGLAHSELRAGCARERSLARVGNPEYAKQNNSFGLTTLHNDHRRRAHRARFPWQARHTASQ